MESGVYYFSQKEHYYTPLTCLGQKPLIVKPALKEDRDS